MLGYGGLSLGMHFNGTGRRWARITHLRTGEGVPKTSDRLTNVRCGVRQRPRPIKTSLEVLERDERKIYEIYQSSWHGQDNGGETCWDDLHSPEEPPLLKHSETDTDGWGSSTLVLYFHGGLTSCASQHGMSISTFPLTVSLVLTFCRGVTSMALGTEQP